ncbi:MAG TPA: hypothetical protein PKW67_01760 [Syntrophomonadaceae bacterium]|nr:hypothetical protein [Syntrophomonadaceae bacterium]
MKQDEWQKLAAVSSAACVNEFNKRLFAEDSPDTVYFAYCYNYCYGVRRPYVETAAGKPSPLALKRR